MKIVSKIFIILLSVLTLAACGPGDTNNPVTNPELEAACTNWKQGGGKNATGGGANPIVYSVSTLEDAYDDNRQPEPGTLRYAVQQSGARLIVFKVAGTIHLKSPLEIKKGNITILGQSAPGDGICIADYPLIVEADNVVIRFLRVRMGDNSKKEYDAVSVNNAHNVIIDHCSMSWSTDECVSCYGNTDFTLQYCFITESLANSVHSKGAHGYGGIWGGTNATFHHNLLAHHTSRNPRFDHSYVENTCFGPLDFVNNVVYNWGGNSAYGGEGVDEPRKINFQNNYFKPGPATKDGVRARLVNPTTSCSNCTDKYKGKSLIPGLFYLDGNVMHGNADVTADNLKGMFPDNADKKSQCVASQRWSMTQDIAMQSAEEALETVLTKGGCSYRRDPIDTRIAGEVRNGNFTYKGSNGGTNGLIDTPSDVGGWPNLSAGEKPKDSDYDGIPDEWEEAHGLNPNSFADGTARTLVEACTNLECYLCDIVKHLY